MVGPEHYAVHLFHVYALLHPALHACSHLPSVLLAGYRVLCSRQLHRREGEGRDVACGRGWFKGRSEKDVQQCLWTSGCNISPSPRVCLNLRCLQVAIKKITNVFEHVSDATRILREIKLLRLLKHPGRFERVK